MIPLSLISSDNSQNNQEIGDNHSSQKEFFLQEILFLLQKISIFHHSAIRGIKSPPPAPWDPRFFWLF